MPVRPFNQVFISEAVPGDFRSIVPLAVPQGIPRLLGHNWAESVDVQTAWETDMVESRIGWQEQGTCTVLRPRRTVQTAHLAKDYEEQAFLDYLVRSQSPSYSLPLDEGLQFAAGIRRVWQQPLFCDAADIESPPEQAALGLPVTYRGDFSCRRFYVGARVAIFPCCANSSLVTIQGIRGSANVAIVQQVFDDRIVTLAPGGDVLGSTGWCVVPLLDVNPSLQGGIQYLTDAFGQANLEGREHYGPNTLPAAAEANEDLTSEWAFHDGLPIVDIDHNWRGGLAGGYTRNGQAILSGQNSFATLHGPRAHSTFSLSVLSVGRSQWWRILRLFDWLRGDIRSFWGVSPQTLWVPNIVASGTQLEVDARGSVTLFRDRTKNLYLMASDGTTAIREIVNVQPNVAGDRWDITLDAALPASFTSMDCVRPASPARFGSNVLRESWTHTGLCELTLPVVERVSPATVEFLAP